MTGRNKRGVRLALALVVALFAVALSAQAAAAYEWSINGVALTESFAVTGSSETTFEIRSISETYECAIYTKGKVKTAGGGEITAVTNSEGTKPATCRLKGSEGYCVSKVEVEPVGLPWSTELVVEGGVLRDKLVGAHEWKFKCKASPQVGGETFTNWCKVTSSVGPHAVSAGVEQIVDSASPVGGCATGNTFITKGVEQLSPSGGGTLGITPTPLEWRVKGAGLAGPHGGGWTGKLKIVGSSGERTLECSDTLEGSVGLGGLGEVTKMTTALGCKSEYGSPPRVSCENVKKTDIEALHLPWHTELTSTEGAVHDTIAGTGGAPGFKTNCMILGIKVSTECTGSLAPKLSNEALGVDAVFAASEKLECKGEVGKTGETATVEGSQLIGEKGLEIT